MAGLQVRVQIHADERMGTTYVLGDVFPADPKAPKPLRQKLRNLEIPAGDDEYNWKTLSLPPGDYEVQVSLPSGQMLTERVRVEPGEATAQLMMHTNSPHEWLSVQHLQGNVGTPDRYRPSSDWMDQALTRGEGDPRTWDDVKLHGRERSREVTTERTAGVFWCVDPDPGGSNPKIWRIVGDIKAGQLSPSVATERFWRALNVSAPPSGVDPVEQDSFSRAYRFRSDGAVGPGGAAQHPQGGSRGGQQTRRYVLVSAMNVARVISAPIPWYQLDDGGEVAFEVLASWETDIATTAIRDPRLGSMIGYLSNNAPQNARRLVHHARDMLFGKVSNPLGAAAGAYVMVSTEEKTDDAAWHRWVRNLHQRFEWIPDGSIAYATMKLNHQRDDEDVDEALEALLEAKRRGIPYFALGMRWLLEGLTSFAYDDRYEVRRDEINAALAEVRALATRTNYQQPFTSLMISRRR